MFILLVAKMHLLPVVCVASHIVLSLLTVKWLDIPADTAPKAGSQIPSSISWQYSQPWRNSDADPVLQSAMTSAANRAYITPLTNYTCAKRNIAWFQCAGSDSQFLKVPQSLVEAEHKEWGLLQGKRFIPCVMRLSLGLQVVWRQPD